MVIHCSAYGCNNKQIKGNARSFYRFPTEPERRKKWINAMQRKNWTPSLFHRLCSDHFISGRKSNNPLSPDYVPSVFIYSPRQTKATGHRSQARFERHVARTKQVAHPLHQHDHLYHQAPNTIQPADAGTQNASEECELEDGTNTSSFSGDSSCSIPYCEDRFVSMVAANEKAIQTEMTADDITALSVDYQKLRNEVNSLKTQIKSFSLEESTFEDNNTKVKVFTGLPSFSIMMAVFGLISGHLKIRKLSAFQQFLLTVMRMRLNLSTYYLAYLFSVSQSTISKIFKDVVYVMHLVIVPDMVFWPTRQTILTAMPVIFRENYRKCVCIIDCFEIFIERPSSLNARALTYSKYKSHNTVKFLIGISPRGTISFISKGWGGRTSDLHVTQNCGIMKYICPGDIVLADRGFNVEELFALQRAQLIIPAFTKGKTQLEAKEIESTRTLASLRIHVERLIGTTRQKYTILQSIIPIPELSSSENYATLDRIVHVACALTNACPSVVPCE